MSAVPTIGILEALRAEYHNACDLTAALHDAVRRSGLSLEACDTNDKRDVWRAALRFGNSFLLMDDEETARSTYRLARQHALMARNADLNTWLSVNS